MDSADQDCDVPSKWHWLQFSLRTIFVLVTLCCVWLALVAFQARLQHTALVRIEQLHGFAAYTFELDAEGLDWIAHPKRILPAWIRRAIGEDYFRQVAIVNFDTGSDLSNEDLWVIERLPNLRQLTLSNSRRVTDAGLVHLAGLRHLKVLVLDGTGVTGPGLIHLQRSYELEGLTLSSTPLADCCSLERLTELPNLKWLHLNDTKITDNGLRRLAHSKSLESIQLVNTNITDAGLKHLQTLRQLKQVCLRGTRTTEQGRASLRQALPNCRIP